MKKKLSNSKTKSRHLIYFLLLLFSMQSYADVICGNIEGFEFTNGHESVNLTDGETYDYDALPGHFFINTLTDGNSQSVRYTVKNLDTGQVYVIVENTLPYTFPSGNGDWNIGNGRFQVTAALYRYNHGIGICDVKTVVFTLGDEPEPCLANAGTLHANASSVTLADGSATISATADGNSNVPAGYSNLYVLTSGEGLVIEAVSATPEFTVSDAGLYTIHTLVYDGRTDSSNFLDLGIVSFGSTTGVDVLTVVTNAGLCASLDVAGAPIQVEEEVEEVCEANAGTLHANASNVNLTDGSATISATADGNSNVPADYSSLYVLTSGEGLVIEAVSATPDFTVSEAGLYTIHTLVYDGRADSANFLDLSIVAFGSTTGVDVLTVVTNAGLCAALDVAGAPIQVEEEVCEANAGALHANASNVNLTDGSASISATADGNSNIPAGYSSLYVLTSGEGLVIEAVSATPDFTVTSAGLYTIHTLVYDGRADSANFLDLGIVAFGSTTGVDVLTVVTNAGLCAALDVAGAPVQVEEEVCVANAGTLRANASNVTLAGGSASISATADGNIHVPAGYSSIFVLTSGEGLVIEAVSATPEFTVSDAGLYTIHTLVYDGREDSANFLDLSIVAFGSTTGVDVLTVVTNAGLCASLDVAGAPVQVEEEVEVCTADAGTLYANASSVTLAGGSATISATADGNINVPAGYSSIFVLTSGEGLVIEAVSATPEFTVSDAGLYTIHTLVYDGREDSANFLDLGIVAFGSTTGVDVLTVVTNAGLCASLNVAGAPVQVESCTADAGTLYANASSVTLAGGSATISATADGNINVPAGYSSIFVLTSGEGLVIEAVSATPEFTVSDAGLYTIHTLVYDGREDSANFLDLGIVAFGSTTGLDVLTVVTNAGLCASLDVAGAPVEVESCTADAGTLYANASSVTLAGGSATISATADGNIHVPAGYSSIFVLTSGEGLVIEAVSATPEFTVSDAGLYTIHTLVYDGREDSANFLDLGIVAFGSTTGVDVLTVVTNAGLCASLDVAGAPVQVEEEVEVCTADAGTLYANASSVTLAGGSATISATADGNINVPAGYSSIFVLTSGEGLVIEAVSATPEFTVSDAGLYTIHTLVYDGRADSANFLDLSIVAFGSTTGVDVLTVVTNAGLCAALDVAGAPIQVEEEVEEVCLANAGTLHANASNVTLADGSASISATADGNSNVPAGYSSLYVLTSGEGLVIEAVSATPEFTVTNTGLYTIHTLVYDGRADSANFLDLSIVSFGSTTGVDVLTIVTNAGLCAALDVAGAPIQVEEEVCEANAGTLHANASSVTLEGGSASISATVDGNSHVPAGYNNLYVLTSGEGLVIEAVSATPEFTVTHAGLYTIHTLVYDGRADSANFLDLGIVVFGSTTGVDVLTVVTNAGLCAALDVAGAPIQVEEEVEEVCEANAGTLHANASSVTLVDGSASISATADGNSHVPAGYSSLYVLTSGEGLVIEAVSATPEFTVTNKGLYTIHTLVYDGRTDSANFLDLSIVAFGSTTGVDVLTVVTNAGLCAALDVAGAPIQVDEEVCVADAGTLHANASNVTLTDGSATISATADGNSHVPAGYSSLYVLTSGEGLVIEAVSATPEFTVTNTGLYTIHTLVYDGRADSANFLDLSIVSFGSTTGVDVLTVVTNAGLCAALDVAGAPIQVEEEVEEVCEANAGTLHANASNVTLAGGSATISATSDGNRHVPAGYSSIFVLTSGEGLVIEAVSATPDFTVTNTGLYTIHTLVYDGRADSANFLDLSIVSFGSTTGVDVLTVVTNAGLCAALDVAGAPIQVEEEATKCATFSGTMYSDNPTQCLEGGLSLISAKTEKSPIIPAGSERLYVLTEAYSLTILKVSSTPEFQVNHEGFYRIHSLVYNPETLDLSVVIPGETTGFDVANLIADNDICASLDVHGAINLVIGSEWFCHFFNKYSNHDYGVSSRGGNEDNMEGFINKYSSYEAFKTDFIARYSISKFFPNPVVTSLKVELELFDNEVVNYNIIDISGRRIISGVASDLEFGVQTIDARNLTSGMYVVQLVSDYRTITKKIVVNK